MDASTISEPLVTDREALQEFIDSLWEYAPTIERDVAHLRKHPKEHAVVGKLFRTLHNIKGDAALCRVEVAVAIVHPMESVLVRVRNGDLPFTNAIADAILLTIDRLELAVERLSSEQTLAGLQLQLLIEGLEKLAAATPSGLDACVAEVIEAVTGKRPVAVMAPAAKRSLGNASRSQTADDLLFFLTLANQFEMRSPRFAGRTMRILRLALETNQMAGNPIDPVQLEAAILPGRAYGGTNLPWCQGPGHCRCLRGGDVEAHRARPPAFAVAGHRRSQRLRPTVCAGMDRAIQSGDTTCR
jgi:chemotaxis protein histidine kinase CheA